MNAAFAIGTRIRYGMYRITCGVHDAAEAARLHRGRLPVNRDRMPGFAAW
jgi:hypothetical protein